MKVLLIVFNVNKVSCLTPSQESFTDIINNLFIIPYIILFDSDKFYKNFGFFSEEKWKIILAAFFLNSEYGDSKYCNTISFMYYVF